MDQTPILMLAAGAATLAAILGTVALLRPDRPAIAGGPETPFATSTEGMKVCARCGMGNLWTERTCSGCGAALKG